VDAAWILVKTVGFGLLLQLSSSAVCAVMDSVTTGAVVADKKRV